MIKALVIFACVFFPLFTVLPAAEDNTTTTEGAATPAHASKANKKSKATSKKTSPGMESSPSSTDTEAAATSAQPSAAVAKAPSVTQDEIKWEKKRGGKLYDEYATALHTKRLHNEFTSAQWKTILLQKRIRIPLTEREHRDLLRFFINE